MGFRTSILSALVAGGTLLTSGQALASVTDFSGNVVNTGQLQRGQSGTITGGGGSGLTTSSISGSLAANDQVTFSYDFTGNLRAGILGSFASYNTGNTQGSAQAIAPFSISSASGTVNGSPSTPLAFSSAQIDFSNNKATAVIQNFSSGVVNYSNQFIGILTGSSAYDVAYSASAVPVPAALPLFGSGILALFGFRRKKKREEEAGALQAA